LHYSVSEAAGRI
jgi:solute carrier family 8 (sodium/calcium exchanger)